MVTFYTTFKTKKYNKFWPQVGSELAKTPLWHSDFDQKNNVAVATLQKKLTGLCIQIDDIDLFEINEAATERTDGGRFDDLLAKAVAHYAASASGLKVPSRSVALAQDTDIESWAPSYASKVKSEMLEWIAGQMRGKRQGNRRLMAMVATFVGATALPLAGQLPNVFDIGL